MEPRTHATYTLSALRRQYTNPHQLYNALRAHDSIYFDTSSQCWLVTGYHEVVAILDDPRFTSRLESAASAPAGAASPLQKLINKQILFRDGEEHFRAQRIILKPLAQMVKSMPAQIKTYIRSVLGRLEKQGEIDIVKDFASPVSLLIIAHILGIPLDDYAQLVLLEQWSDTFGDITSGYFRGNMQDINRLEDYFRQLIHVKREAPSDDLLSAFIEARDVFVDDDDLVANCIMVFGAGRITTKKVLGNGLPILMQEWERWQREYTSQPALPRQLAEELFRMTSPTRYLMRQASEDSDLSQQFPSQHLIRRGERLLLFLEAANYDPRLFPEPETFYPFRRPNKHIAFGFGPHQCPGATLARIEVQIALELLLSAASLRSHHASAPVWSPNPNLGGYSSFPADFTLNVEQCPLN